MSGSNPSRGRMEIITLWNSIHGRTWLTGSASGVPKRKAGYGPFSIDNTCSSPITLSAPTRDSRG